MNTQYPSKKNETYFSKNLFMLVNSLSKSEFYGFEKFIKSPYFNTKQKCIDLYMVIKEYYPKLLKGENCPKLKKEVVFKRLFPKRDVNTSNALTALSSEVAALLEQYLKQIALDNSSYIENIFLLREYNKRELKRHFNSLKTKTENAMKGEKQSMDYFRNQFSINDEYFAAITNETKVKESSLYLNKSLQSLELFAILKKLENYCLMLNNSSVRNIEDFDLQNLDSFVESLKKSPYLEYPAIDTYYSTLLLLRGHTERYAHLKEILLQNPLPKNELKELYTMVLTYFNQRIKNGDLELVQERYEWYLNMLEKGLCHKGKWIEHGHLKNIIALCLHDEKFDLAQKIIKKYSNQVAPKYRDVCENYNLASLYFYQKNYNDSIDSLKEVEKVEKVEIFYAIGRRSLLLKIYYEKGLLELESFDNLIKAFKKWIEKNAYVSQKHKRAYINFIKKTEKLYKLKTNPNTTKEKIQKFIQSLEGVVLSDPKWILKKANELLKKKK